MKMHDCKLAEAYVPFQEDTSMFLPEAGLVNGTIFTALNQPYNKGCGCGYREDKEKEDITCKEMLY